MDKTRDSIRTIETFELTHIFQYVTTDGAISLACKIHQDSQDTIYNLQLKIFEEDAWLAGDKILCKLSNGEIITIVINDVIRDDAAVVKKTLLGEIGLSATTLKCFITEAQLSDMVRYGVTKIRIETLRSYEDCKVYKNKFSEAVLNCYRAITRALKTQPTIYDDF